MNQTTDSRLLVNERLGRPTPHVLARRERVFLKGRLGAACIYRCQESGDERWYGFEEVSS
jgi:hypothetical protein